MPPMNGYADGGPLNSAASAENEGASRLDEYRITTTPIGMGKFAIVYRAQRVSDNETVALKKILIDTMDERARHKCLKEVRLLESLEHPNIIKYLDSFIHGNELVIVFEWAAAGDLKRQIRKAQERQMLFEERVVWKYFSQIAEAIRHMHARRIMHRDLKPANIFLTLDGQVKVGDLGLSRAMSEHTLEVHSKVGTPLYMSPEVLGAKGYDWKSDIWSLGCLLYELAMLRSPFKSEGLNIYNLFQKISRGDYKELPAHYSDELKDLSRRMISVEPSQRPDINEVCHVASQMRERFANNSHAAPGPRAEEVLLRRTSSADDRTANAGEVVYAFDQHGYEAGAVQDEDDGATVPTTNGNNANAAAAARWRPRAAPPPDSQATANGTAGQHGGASGGIVARRAVGGGARSDGSGGSSETRDQYNRAATPEGGSGSATPPLRPTGAARQRDRRRQFGEEPLNGPHAANGANAANGGSSNGPYPAEEPPSPQELSGLETVLVQRVYDRLCVLAYDDVLRSQGQHPLGRLHFAFAGGGERLTARQQFIDFLSLVEWGLEGLGVHENLVAGVDEASPFLLATAALNACSSAAGDGAATALAGVVPVQLVRGSGEPVLRVLDWLTAELVADYVPPALVYKTSSGGLGAASHWALEGEELEETNGDSLEVAEEDFDLANEEDELDVVTSSLDEGRIAAEALDASMTMLVPVVDVERWREEVERVRPRLKAAALAGDWHSRMEILEDSGGKLLSLGVRPAPFGGGGASGELGSAMDGALAGAKLARPSSATVAKEDIVSLLGSAERGIAEQRAAIARSEKYLSASEALAALAHEERAEAAVAASAALRRAELEAAVAGKAEQLQALQDEAAEEERQLAEKGAKLSDATALHRARRAVQDLRAEVAAMDIRVGLVSSALWTRQRQVLEAKRVATARGARKSKSGQVRQSRSASGGAVEHDDSLSL